MKPSPHYVAQVSIHLMSHKEAEAFIKQVGQTGFVDSWRADARYSFVVHSQDATEWNLTAQFIQIQRLWDRRMLSLILDENVEGDREDIPAPKETALGPTSPRTSYVFLILQGILGSVFRTEVKRTVKRAIWVLLQSTLAYFEDLRGKPHVYMILFAISLNPPIFQKRRPGFNSTPDGS